MSRTWGSRPRAQRLVEFEGRVGCSQAFTNVINYCEIRDSFLGRPSIGPREKATTVVALITSTAASSSPPPPRRAPHHATSTHAHHPPLARFVHYPLQKRPTLTVLYQPYGPHASWYRRPLLDLVPPPGQAAVRRARAAVTGLAEALEHIAGTAASPATWMHRTNVGTLCSSAAFEAWFRGSSGGDERRSRRRGPPLRRRRDPREAGRDAPRRGVAWGAAGGGRGGPRPCSASN